MASPSPWSSLCNSTRRAPLYPRYEVSGRGAVQSTAWRRRDYAKRDQCWADRPLDALPTPLERMALSLTLPTLPSSSLPTIDAPNERIPRMSKLPPNPKAPCTGNNATRLEQATEDEPLQLPGKKRQRYLRDVDRRSIIQRIDNGEKQADLAREFGVTRAAICHLKKNRELIVSRFESLLASAKALELTMSPKTPTAKISLAVHELTQPSVQLLLTTMRDATTSHPTFRASANRLMMVLLEEALTSATTVSDTVRTTAGQSVRGLTRTACDLCCVGVGEKGWPLLQLYRLLEPRGLIGSVDFTTSNNGSNVDRLTLLRACMLEANFLLLSVSSATGESLCASVRTLQQAGVAVEHIIIAALVCTSGAVNRVTTEFPGIQILTCAIESTPRPATTFRDFLERYDGVKCESVEKTASKQSVWRDASSSTQYHQQ